MTDHDRIAVLEQQVAEIRQHLGLDDLRQLAHDWVGLELPTKEVPHE